MASVYLDYDQAALDAQYNLRAAVPDHPEDFARWAAASDAARRDPAARLDVAYGDGAMERLDVFPAPVSAPAPILVFFHGGYWRALDKADFSFPAPAFGDAGIVYASVNYSLAPAADMDRIVRQCRRAVAWLWRNAGTFGGDPARLYVAGHSAGGHLTGMLLTGGWQAAAGLPEDAVKGGVAVSGVFDLEPVRLTYLNADLSLDPASVRRNSPIHHLPAPGRPLVLAVGDLETAEFRRQQAAYADACRAAGIACEVVSMPGRHHFDVVDGLGEGGSPLFAATCRMVSRPAAAVAGGER